MQQGLVNLKFETSCTQMFHTVAGMVSQSSSASDFFCMRLVQNRRMTKMISSTGSTTANAIMELGSVWDTIVVS